MKNLYHFFLLAFTGLALVSYNTNAQAPIFITNVYNPCGGNGSNEFLVGRASSTAFDPLKVYYFVSGANPDGSGKDSSYQSAFCGSVTATGSGSSACNAVGWTRSAAVGSASWRIMNYTNAADKQKVDTLIARLNAQAATCSGGCPNLFVAPDSVTGLIPANANFVFFISTAANDTNTYTPKILMSLCGLCGRAPIYVMAGSFPQGASGLVVNTGVAPTSRFISLAYDFGGSTGVAEIYSYLHIPPASALTTKNYYQAIPQGANSLNNTTAVNSTTTTCDLLASAVLSVKWLNFSGRYDNGNVILTWETSNEVNTSHFNIQSSGDGNNFETTGNVPAKNRGQVLTTYYFTDNHPPANDVFYRLQEVDMDGVVSYSKTIRVNSTAPDNTQSSVYPNPAGNLFYLNCTVLQSTTAEISIVNNTGMTLKHYETSLSAGSNKESFAIPELAPGMYYIKVQTAANNWCMPLVKE